MRVRLRGIRLVNQGSWFRSRVSPAFHVRRQTEALFPYDLLGPNNEGPDDTQFAYQSCIAFFKDHNNTYILVFESLYEPI